MTIVITKVNEKHEIFENEIRSNCKLLWLFISTFHKQFCSFFYDFIFKCDMKWLSSQMTRQRCLEGKVQELEYRYDYLIIPNAYNKSLYLNIH